MIHGENMGQTPENKNSKNQQQESEKKGYLLFARTRIFAGIIIIVVVLWLLNGLVNLLNRAKTDNAAVPKATAQARTDRSNASLKAADITGSKSKMPLPSQPQTGPKVSTDKSAQPSQPAPTPKKTKTEKEDLLSKLGLTSKVPKGVTFTTALIVPLNYELRERWWGWRPNDIINVTDNVNNFQVGVLEVTRRTTVILTDRISRSSSTDALDKHLENAMNAFMISADRYWFPSAESKYKEGLEELKAYAESLQKGQAHFFTRTDNLIPLIRSFEDLVGSCDENLIKTNEADGSKVSHFMADDYFFYAQGVASALHIILQAVQEDYKEVLESRRAADDMHLAIESLHRAMQIDPIYITNADLSGILANHRANIAATISRAQSYLQVVVTALST